MIAGEVVRMVCSNEACPYNQYVPLNTFQEFEEYVLMALKKAPRARGWTQEQCRMNLWTKKGYELVYRACGCNCGKGFVRRDMQYLEPMVLLGDGSPPQPKSKVAQQAPVPPRKMSAEMALPQPKPGPASTPAPMSAAPGNGHSNGVVANGVLDDDSSDEEGVCPLCMEEMDTTDQTFLPCACGYQMCLYCFNHVKENLNGQCPACRSPYDTNNYRFKAEPLPKRHKEKKDPAVKEAEMMAQAQVVARQQAQVRADMIARAQAAQAQMRNGEAEQQQQQQQQNQRPDIQARAQAHQARVAAQNQDPSPGSWAAITSNVSGDSSAMLPPPPNSQAWPSLGGSAAPSHVERMPTQEAGWAPTGGDVGEVDDWEQLAGEETRGVPGLDDAKNDAEVAALLRHVSELQRKLQEARDSVQSERQAREESSQKCNTIRALQVAFDQELMTMATRWQLDAQQENDRALGLDGGVDVVAPMPVGPPTSSVPAWPQDPSPLPPPGVPAVQDLWGGAVGGGYSAFAGLSQAPVPEASMSGSNQMPGLSSIFGNYDSSSLGVAPGGSSVWGTSTGVSQSTTQSSPWGTSIGGGASSIW